MQVTVIHNPKGMQKHLKIKNDTLLYIDQGCVQKRKTACNLATQRSNFQLKDPFGLRGTEGE